MAEVLESTNPNYKPGDIIVPYKGWVSHGVLDASETERVIKHNPEHGPVSTALGKRTRLRRAYEMKESWACLE